MLQRLKTYLILLIVAVFLFLGIHWFHGRVLGMTVILYGSVLDAALAILGTALLFHFMRFRRSWDLEPIFFFSSLFLALVIYCIMVPTLVDRSLSVFVLETVEQKKRIDESKLEGVILSRYLKEMDVTNQRIQEQLASGTIVRRGNEYVLSPWGHTIVEITRFYKENLLPRKDY